MISINKIARGMALNENYRIINSKGENYYIARGEDEQKEQNIYVGLYGVDTLQQLVTIGKKESLNSESVYFHYYSQMNPMYDVVINFLGKDSKSPNSIFIRAHHSWAKFSLVIGKEDHNEAYFIFESRIPKNVDGEGYKLVHSKEKIDIGDFSTGLVIRKIYDVIKKSCDDKMTGNLIGKSFNITKPAIVTTIMDIEKEWIKKISGKYNQLLEYYNQQKAISESKEEQEVIVAVSELLCEYYREGVSVLGDQLESLLFTIVDETLSEDEKGKII